MVLRRSDRLQASQRHGEGAWLCPTFPAPIFLLTEKANRVKQDKNIRPYAISIDWLQLYCWNSGGFNPEYDTMTHHFADVGHGSKVFRKIYNVVDADGCLIGNISLDPYSDAINKNTVIFKAENNILYEPDAIPRILRSLRKPDCTTRA